MKYRLTLKLSVRAFGIFFIVILGYFFYIRPDLIHKKLIQSQIVGLKYELDQRNRELARFYNLKEQVKLMDERFFSNSDGLHGIDHGKRLFDLISGRLLSKKLADRHVKVFHGENKCSSFVFPVDIRFVLQRDIIYEFLGQLSRKSNPLLLLGLQYGDSSSSPESENIDGILSAHFIVYRRNDDFFNITRKLYDRVFDYKNTQTNKENPLTKYKIDQLEMRGFIGSDTIGRIFGLIRIPDKNTYKIEIGDEVGLEREIVSHIDRYKITLKKDDRKYVLEIKK